MAGVYVVLGVGLVLSFLVLIAEIVWKRKLELKARKLKVTVSQWKNFTSAYSFKIQFNFLV